MRINISREDFYFRDNKPVFDNIHVEARADELDVLADVIKTIDNDCGMTIIIHTDTEEYILEYSFDFDKSYHKTYALRMSRVSREFRHLLRLKDNFTEYQLDNFKELIKVINSHRGLKK